MANTDYTYGLIYVSNVELDSLVKDNLAAQADDIKYFTIRYPASGVAYFEIDQFPKTANLTFYIRYYKKMADLNSYGDTTPVPIPQLLEDYACAMIFGVKGDETKKAVYETRFREGVQTLRREQKKQVGQPDFIQFRGQRGYMGFKGESPVTVDKESRW